MSSALSALAPVFGMIVIGYLLKARGGFGEGFWEPVERLTFYFLFPALLVAKIGGAEAGGAELLPMAAALIAATLIMAGGLVAAVHRLRDAGIEDQQFVALMQGAIRPNTYVGLAAAYTLFGNEGLTLAAVAVLAVIPLVNFISIIALLRWNGVAGESSPPLFLAFLKNPIIIGCGLGAIFYFSGTGLPPVIGPMLDILGGAALPLGLMAVGAGLDFKAVNERRGAITLATALKLAVMPALVLIACWVFGVSGIAQTVAVLFGALPVAAGSYVMTRQMGGDGTLMAGIVTATIIAAAVTLPVVIALVG